MPRVVSRLSLLGGIFVYFVSSLGGVAIVKFLNYKVGLSSWAIFAMLSRSTWVLSLCLHVLLQKREGASIRQSSTQLLLYFGIAGGLAIVELLNALSMTILPGSWYALMKGSDIGFSMVLSRLILGKQYRWGQIMGSSLVMGGIAIAFLLGDSSLHQPNSKLTLRPVSVPIALGLCLLAAFLNAALAVLTEATLKKTLKAEEERLLLESNAGTTPSKLLLSNAYSMWTTFFAFVILVPIVLFSGQFRESLEVLHASAQVRPNADNDAIILPTKLPIMILGISLSSLGISRFVERLSKHWICVADSAVIFSLVQAARRLTGVFVIAFIFQEGFPMQILIGSSFSGFGFSLHYWSGLEEEEPVTGNSVHQYELVSTQDRTTNEGPNAEK